MKAELSKVGIGRKMADEAVEMAGAQGELTVFAMVDALTRLSKRNVNAGDRTEVDQQAGRLLTLVT